MKIDFVSKEDLVEFKLDLIKEIRQVLKEKNEGGVSQQWLRSADVRKLLGISPGTLQNLRVNGILPYRKIKGMMFYDKKEIIKMMEKGDDDA